MTMHIDHGLRNLPSGPRLIRPAKFLAQTSVPQTLASYAAAADASPATRQECLRQKLPELKAARFARKRTPPWRRRKTPAPPSAVSTQSNLCPARDADQTQKITLGTGPRECHLRYQINRKRHRRRKPPQICQHRALGRQTRSDSPPGEPVARFSACGFRHSKIAAKIKKQPNSPFKSREGS